MRRSLLTPVAPVLVGLGALAGCGSEAAPPDDGAQSSVVAGAADALGAAGVDVVSVDAPVSATAAEVADALGLTDDDALPDDALALDAGSTAGLIAVTGSEESDGELLVALAFDTPVSAIVFASADPDVIADAEVADRASAHLSGNVVVYYAPAPDGGTDVTDGVRRRLAQLQDSAH